MLVRIAPKSDLEEESLAKAESGKPTVFIKGEGVMTNGEKPEVECFFYCVIKKRQKITVQNAQLNKSK